MNVADVPVPFVQDKTGIVLVLLKVETKLIAVIVAVTLLSATKVIVFLPAATFKEVLTRAAGV